MAWLLLARYDPNTSVLSLPLLPEISLPLIQKG